MADYEAKISDLKFDDKNFNRHTEYGMSLIEKSLRENGAGRSILIDKDGNIIAGNGIVESAGQIGLDKVKVVETTGDEIIAVKRTDISLNSKKGRKMALADNSTAKADLEWDEENLKSEFEEEELKDWGVDLDWQEETEVTEDEAPEVNENEPADSELGKVYKLGNHRLMCGDSTDAGSVAILMDGQKADMVFTDPPYGVSYTEKNEFLNSLGEGHRLTKAIENDSKTPEEMYDFWIKSFRILHDFTKDRMAYYVTAPQGGDLLLLLLQALRDSGFMLKHQLVWNKNNHVLGRCDYNYKHEPIIYGWKIGGTHNFYGNGKFKTSVWDIDKPLKNDLHPTMKPIELITNAILDATQKNDIVIDLFLGSGSTLIACEQTGRKCYGCEIDPKYCDVIRKRYWKFTTGSEEGWQNGTRQK